MNTNSDTLHSALDTAIANGGDRLAGSADEAQRRTQEVADSAADRLHKGVDELRTRIPESVGSAALRAEDLARRSLDRARDLANQARHRASEVRHATTERVQADPMKALLIAAAAGAATALLVRWLSQPRRVD
jgi:ElaB/YqjD/DUF883 family membrane-anchored ribosome-binding protein